MDFLEEAHTLAELLLEQFFDSVQGGFYPYAKGGEQLITRNREVYDGAMPSGSAVAALVLSRLARLTGQARWREAATLQLSYLTGAVQRYLAGHSFTLLTLLEELWPTAELVCASGSFPEDLISFLREGPHPGLTVLLKTPEDNARLAALAPFTADYPIPVSGTKYYLCRGKTCSSPVDAIDKLQNLI